MKWCAHCNRETWEGQIITDADQALLRFVGKVDANSASVAREDVEVMICAGWTEMQVAETVHIAALFAAFNRVANGFGLPSPYTWSVEESQ